MPGGRKSKYTPELVKIIIDALSVGATDGDACLSAGIDESTFYDWMNKKPEFSDRVTRARSNGWIADLAVIKRAGINGDWRAAGEHLDRTRSPYRKSQETILSNGAQDTPFVYRLEVIE